MNIEQSRVLSHAELSGGYRTLELLSPLIAGSVNPGQFVHIHVPRLEASVLRRPFSVFRARDGVFSILYKKVGRGTEALTLVQPGDELNVMGPLGNGFPLDCGSAFPVLVAGGYGVAPLFFLAQRLPSRGILFAGGASREHVLCTADFEALGWEVRVATEDGSLGTRGLVTAALDEWKECRRPDVTPVFFACGPDGMLKALARRAVAGGWTAWLSLDKHMGCGVGACLACVQKIRLPDGAEVWARVCREGPVFEARQIVWQEQESRM